MSWINYLLEANLYLALFYTAYYLLFRRETYYQLNRIYLLSSSALAFLIPIFQLGFLKPISVTTQVSLAAIPEVTAAGTQATIQIVPQNAIAVSQHIDYLLIYAIVAILLTLRLAVRLFQLFKLAKRGNRNEKQDFMLIEIDEDDRAFSFFNYLFIGKKLSTSDTIIQHELVHIRQRHSFDIIYLEILKIICWFNPFVYLLQYSVKELHEYIADNHISASQQNVNDYTDFLIGNAYGLSETALTNNFFNNKLLKNRIMMLHQTRSGSLVRLKYLAALPMLAGMLCLSTLGFTKNYTVIDLAPGYVNYPAKTIPVKAATTNVMRSVSPSIPTKSPKLSSKLKSYKQPLRIKSAPVIASIDTLPKGKFDILYKQLITKVKYPKDAREKNIQGRVFAAFDVDNYNQVGTIKIVKSPDDMLSNEVIRSLKDVKTLTSFKQGVTYVLPVYFVLSNPNPNKQDDGPGQNNTVTQSKPGDLHHDQQVDLNEIVIVAQAAN